MSYVINLSTSITYNSIPLNTIVTVAALSTCGLMWLVFKIVKFKASKNGNMRALTSSLTDAESCHETHEMVPLNDIIPTADSNVAPTEPAPESSPSEASVDDTILNQTGMENPSAAEFHDVSDFY